MFKKTILCLSLVYSGLCFSGSYDNVANFLTGKNSEQQFDYYKTYSKETSNAWNKYYKKQFEPIIKWRDNNPIKSTDVENVFYPFGGPDISHAITFYPNAKKYTLIGLEPVGKIPENFDKMSNADKQKGLENLKQAVSGVLGRNFFITFDMQKEVKNTDFNGVASMLLFFLSELGNTVEDVKYIENNGVSIRFLDSNKMSHELIYYSWDVSNKGLEKNSSRKTILSENVEAPHTVTILKAASYLCWLDDFSQIRNYILKTNYIMSDVSGMPIKYLKNNNYNVSVQGTYLGPIESFKWAVDKDLKDMTKNNKNLPFKYSYNIHGESHLFFGQKKENN